MELLENVPNDAMVKAVKEWCKLNSSKPVIADFRATAITKSPYSAIKKELNFKSKYQFDQSIEKTIGWYLENISWVKSKLKK